MKTSAFRSISIGLILFSMIACKNDNTEAIINPSEKLSIATNIENTQFRLEETFPALTFSEPVGLYQSKNKQWFLIEQSGVIKTFSQNGDNEQAFLNIKDRVRSGGERGLLGMALDPDFENNGYFYVCYTSEDNNSIISLFSSKGYIADTKSEKILLSIPQPYSNHNGGQISFGPDGYLYIGLGDGGSGGDPKQNGQNINTLLGSMLRIDVSKNNGAYAIPATNPFVNERGKKEIYAYGLRNPWRWSFDKKTGELWVGDVGQNQWEEIDLIKSGGNYGWNITEGNHCFNEDNCDQSNLIKPIYEYSHGEGYAITGGYVYRGSTIEALEGYYVYGDYVTKKIWALRKNENNQIENNLILNSPLNISSFAEDIEGNLFVIGYKSGKVFSLKKQ
ncbi:MAG: PQQ-dependent sugar dehydrogenase [Gammaproteobacteria bacterium]|nr:PQQ-dependent sugar dehydrogenase [Gammaproteobacteria bacterium]